MIKLIFSFGLFITLFLATPVLAVDVIDPACDTASGNAPALCGTDTRGTGNSTRNNALVGDNGILTRTTEVMSWALGIVSVIMFIVGAIRISASNGSQESVQSGRNTITYAIIGLVVSIAAQAIVVFVLEAI